MKPVYILDTTMEEILAKTREICQTRNKPFSWASEPIIAIPTMDFVMQNHPNLYRVLEDFASEAKIIKRAQGAEIFNFIEHPALPDVPPIINEKLPKECVMIQFILNT